MKILFISDVYFPRVNGVSTSIRTFATQLQRLGHEVHLIAPDYAGATEDESWIRRIPASSIYFDPEDRLMKWKSVLSILPDLKRAQFDVIHVHTPFIAHYFGLRLARELKLPIIETYHTFFEEYLHYYLPWIPKSIARSMARRISERQCNAVDAIVAPSAPMLSVLRAYGVKTTAEVIPTGLQEKSFEPADGAAFRRQYQIPLDRPMLLYVGRVAHEKNIGFLLEMTKQLVQRHPEALLVVAGEGPAEASLHEQAKRLGLEHHIQFIGYLDRNTELNACYQAADIFVFASKSETQGLVLLEAMAQGTPVVAIAELGTASILVEGFGALIAPDHVQQFADRVGHLLTHPEECHALGEFARDYAKANWTAQRQAERMLNFYHEVMMRHDNQTRSKKCEPLNGSLPANVEF